MVKRNIRAFEREIAAKGKEWSPRFMALAQRKLLALKSRDQPNLPELMERLAVRDIAAFDVSIFETDV